MDTRSMAESFELTAQVSFTVVFSIFTDIVDIAVINDSNV